MSIKLEVTITEKRIVEMILENIFSWIHGPANTPATESGSLTVTEEGTVQFYITIKKITTLECDFSDDPVCNPCDPNPCNDTVSARLTQYNENGGYYLLNITWNVASQRKIHWKVVGRNP